MNSKSILSSEKPDWQPQSGGFRPSPSPQGNIDKINAVSKETLDKLNNWKNFFKVFLVASAIVGVFAFAVFLDVGNPIGLIVVAALLGATLAIPGGGTLYYHMKVKKLEKAGRIERNPTTGIECN